MEFDAFKQLVFDAIAAHDGMWSWYQLGRHVTPQAPEMARELMLHCANWKTKDGSTLSTAYPRLNLFTQ